MTAKILVADPNPANRHYLAKAFAAEGWRSRFTAQPETLLKWVAEGDVGAVVIELAGANDPAHQVAQTLRRLHPAVPVVATTRETSLSASAQAIVSGVFEALPKPYQAEDLVALIVRSMARPGSRRSAATIRDSRLSLIGRSAAMRRLYQNAARLVQSTVPVLIAGETGTGKALIARSLHDLGPRRAKRFVALNLVSLAPSDIADQLAGRPGVEGLIAQAEGGTLYLHAVDDLSADSQARLLRVLNETGVDGPDTRSAPDVRLIASGAADLFDRVGRGQFREDLFFRLGVAMLAVPPLRSRPDDIPELAQAFLYRGASAGGAPQLFDSWALQRLRAHEWPGNVRELENLVRRIQAHYPHATICADIVGEQLAPLLGRTDGVTGDTDNGRRTPPAGLALAVEREVSNYFADASSGAPGDLHEHITRAVEAPLLQTTLLATRGNKSRAAALLGISRSTLCRKVDELGLAAAGADDRS